MIQVTSHMRIVVAVEPVDFRNGIDGLVRVCKEVLKADPFAGWFFVFRSRRGTAIKGALLRWPGILSGPEASFDRSFPVLAGQSVSSLEHAGGPSAAGAACCG